MIISKFLNPKNDIAFKRIFGTEHNKDILIHFINDMLCFEGDNKIQTVSFLKPSQDPEVAYKKQSIVDVLCTDPAGRQYIVEMQVAKSPGFEKRAQYYAAKAYSQQLDKGDPYENLREVIFLAITDFVMFPDKPAYKSDHITLDKSSYEHDLKDFSFTFLELPKFNKEIDELQTMIEKWTYFFKHAEDTREKDLTKLVGSDQIIERAYEQLNRFSWSKQEIFTYEQEEKHELDNAVVRTQELRDAEEKGLTKGLTKGLAKGLAKGLEKGLAKGKVEGFLEGQLSVAKNLVAQGMADKLILQATGLSEEALIALKKQC